MIELTFADQNVRVVAVGDGQHAIDRIEADPPDIVLADVGMPTRNGYEVAAFVKSTPRLAHIPVLLLTGAFEPVDEARARAIGCDGLLVKPFEPQMVIARVHDLLGRRRPNEVRQAGDAPGSAEAARASSAPGIVAPGPDPVGEYFDRLDKAFAKLDESPRPSAALNTVLDTRLLDREGERPAATLAGPPPAAPPASVAEAFGVLLSAEQGEGPPLHPRATGASAPALDEELVEAVVARVLSRLGDSVVRTRVDDIVSAVAERLVREEIDRIKASSDRRSSR